MGRVGLGEEFQTIFGHWTVVLTCEHPSGHVEIG